MVEDVMLLLELLVLLLLVLVMVFAVGFAGDVVAAPIFAVFFDDVEVVENTRHEQTEDSRLL